MADKNIKRLLLSVPLAMVMMVPAYQLPKVGKSGSVITMEANFANARRFRGEARRVARRTARRTTRRTVRRHSYYRSLPSSCRIAHVSGNRYWYCGGVYYRQAIDNGATVYIVVNP